MKYLIAGLGNIGDQYQLTRHNIGFQIVDALADSQQVSFQSGRLGHIAKATYKGRTLVLLKPTTYMNKSGHAIRHHLQSHHIPISNLLVIVDDLSLPFGKLRLRTKGSHGGHNGLKNITEEIQTSEYTRLRFGINDLFQPGKQSNYVLDPFTPKEQKELPLLIQKAIEIPLSFCWRGSQHTMTLYN